MRKNVALYADHHDCKFTIMRAYINHKDALVYIFHIE